MYHRAIVMVLFQLLKLSARKNCGGKHVYFFNLIIERFVKYYIEYSAKLAQQNQY